MASSSLRPLLLAQCRASGMKDPLSLGPEAHRWSLWRSLAPEFPLRLPGPSDELPASSLAPPGLCSAHVPSSCFLGSDCSAVQSYEWVTRSLHLGFGFCCVPALPAVRGTLCRLADACLSSCLFSVSRKLCSLIHGPLDACPHITWSACTQSGRLVGFLRGRD